MFENNYLQNPNLLEIQQQAKEIDYMLLKRKLNFGVKGNKVPLVVLFTEAEQNIRDYCSLVLGSSTQEDINNGILEFSMRKIYNINAILRTLDEGGMM